MTSPIDIFDDVPDAPSEDGLSRLSRLFRKRQEASNEVERLAAELKVAQETLRGYDEKELPELFDEVGVTSFGVDNYKVTIKEKLYGGLPKDDVERAAAFAILKAHGGDALMKMEVSASFNKGENEKAMEAAEAIKAAGFNPVVNESIHSATYQKWAREMLEKGIPIDLKALGLYHRRFIEIK